MDQIILLALCALIGYGFGSVPSGLLLTRAVGGPDIRTIGSGNIGATNVLRTGNKLLAATTLLFDILKGTLPVMLGGWLMSYYIASTMSPAEIAARLTSLTGNLPTLAAIIAGLGAFLGHLYPVWLKFKGGKGVATRIGVLLGLAPLLALAFLLIWLASAFTLRISSASALIASALVPLIALSLAWHSDRWPDLMIAATCFILSALLYHKHKDNIRRLMAGTEPKIGAK